ncbi:salicylate hydroxylase [Rhizodiscina lignyota]|uniref:Salicylate hydroxylase n=1 Tax=Rhizodiscina lignyota TaxID=1504668 RepID=A0A9P4I7P1_9PEZI|nr:salicylate hydroxylase [Rhizodiscina lignyota]
MSDTASNASNIRVIIVGAGFAGLTAAIECIRKGHSVTLLESFKELKPLGDVISFGSNAGRIFMRWPGIEQKLDRICHNSDRLRFYTYKGEHICDQVWDDDVKYGKRFNGHRGQIHEILFDYAQEVGVKIRLGFKVSEYFETDDEAGVICNGERIAGDVVLAADGVRSTARTIVLGYEDKPKSSGYAIYRAWMPSKLLEDDPLTRELVANGDSHVGFLGPDIHWLGAAVSATNSYSWVCTHQDTRDVEESWQAPGDVEDACRVLEGWSPVVHAIARATPPETLVDWKLVYRDPLPTWISPKSRIALIGDAAHPFLPTSIQGASQAMEDGVTVAICLELSGKGHERTALRAFEKMRYDRVLKAQQTGVSTRDKWHKADFDRILANPHLVKLPREAWLLAHDAEAHAYSVYADTVASLEASTKASL